jgi:hypothetical protein
MIPSPVYWFTVPSKRCTPSVRIWKKRSRSRCHSSASTCSAISIEPFTSAKRTVTCLRSPSSADLDCQDLVGEVLRGVSAPTQHPLDVIPAQAGIQSLTPLDARLRIAGMTNWNVR